MRILLVDMSALYYKSYFAFINQPLKNKKGEETSVIFGVFTTLIKILKERSYDRLFFIHDSPVKTFRHSLYEAYKANRPPMPHSLKEQIAFLNEVLKKTGVPCVTEPGYEADDIIASAACLAEEKNSIDECHKGSGQCYNVEILSGDKDLMQLVSDHTIMIQNDRTGKGFKITDTDAVKKKWGIAPSQIADFLSLLGDSSDNVPGVKGVGQKTAARLLNDYGSLDGIYVNLNKMKGALKKKLEDGRESAFLSRDLVKLDKRVKSVDENFFSGPPDEIDPTPLYEDLKAKELYKIIEGLGLSSVSSVGSWNMLRIKKNNGHADSVKDSAVQESNTVQLKPFKRFEVTPGNYEPLIKKIKNHKEFVIDLETTSLDPLACRLVAAVFVFKDHTSFYVQITEAEYDCTDDFITSLKSFLEDEEVKKNGHNLKYEYAVFKKYGVDLKGIFFDTMLAAYLIDPLKTHYNLESLVNDYFQIIKKSYKEMAGSAEDIYRIDPGVLKEYAYSDGEYTWRLYEKLSVQIEPQKNVFFEQEIELVKILAMMERRGVQIDGQFLKEYDVVLKKELEDIEKQIYTIAGEAFNINSTKQLQKILFEKMGIKPVRKTKTGYSTDMKVLEKLSGRHPVAELLVGYRNTAKLRNTYVKALPKLIHPHTGRIHTNYNQAVTATGRLSSTNPNLQNIPVKKHNGRSIRAAFTVPEGYEIAALDYSQVELRVLAYLSKDEMLLKAYENGEDIHKTTASLLFADGKKVTDSQRAMAKIINFSVIYGISPWALADQLKISQEKARRFIDGYFRSYSGVSAYTKQILKEAYDNGYVKTHYGRMRPLPDIRSENKNIRAHAERAAFNTVIQGTAADIIKRAMIRVHEAVSQGEIKADMVMQVHDELVFYIREGDQKTADRLAVLMRSIKPFDKILEVSMSVGKNWDMK